MSRDRWRSWAGPGFNRPDALALRGLEAGRTVARALGAAGLHVGPAPRRRRRRRRGYITQPNDDCAVWIDPAGWD